MAPIIIILKMEVTLMEKDSVVVVFTKYITKNGKKIYASWYGLNAFRLEIPVDKYKSKG